jgi:hypothetical protein
MLKDRTRRPRQARAKDRAWLRAAAIGLAALGLLSTLPLAGEARAGNDLAAAQALYQRGEMRAAARLARKAGGAQGLTLAARAALVDALYLAAEVDKSALLDRAAADARAALTAAPDYEPAYLQLAIALGQMAERIDPITAHVSGYADQGRALLQRARALAPADPWPDGLLGIWHLQLVRHGSAALAAEFYGASEADGVTLCRQATARAPKAIALRYGCALSMLELDPERLGPEAIGELTAISRMPAADAAERLVQRAALERLSESGRSATSGTK